MNVRTIDHLNLRIPADSVEQAADFYGDALGFDIEGLERYESGETPFFDVRLTARSILHLWPTQAFVEPSDENYDHLALTVEHPIESIRAELADAGVSIERELERPLGATGRAPAVYIRDPFGYRIELKQPV